MTSAKCPLLAGDECASLAMAYNRIGELEAEIERKDKVFRDLAKSRGVE